MKIIPFDRKLFRLTRRIILAILFLLLFIFACRIIYFVPSVPVTAIAEENPDEEKKYIKWVDCNVTLSILEKTSKLDIDSHNKNEEVKLNWIELISYLACKTGNNFKSFKQKDLDNLVARLRSGEAMEEITKDMKNYGYYFESYNAIFKEFIGEYEIETTNENGQLVFQKKYGLKAFLPVAKGYSFSHYSDFGNSRNYGYKRVHLGNDLMGSIGTPIVAVESGVVEACRMESIWWLENWNKKF